ncbi:hypothetical protein [Rhodanobacter sp. MP7CTX1]|uniref:hypothetical protein n=1 Tax=Rhodanobacter sp. MP7CTX1 TaxID=2723084 RepID=UPI0016116EBE|nr:hypothetical protein [Rhodanobacter sp. MP7CTX1]MBB6188088.1 hypothetical protein [Rhodanobacter sp. MP7CTX1]
MQHDFGMTLEQHVDFADSFHVHHRAAMNAQEVILVERLLQVAQRFEMQEARSADMAAVPAPALRASRVSPVEATRSA